jgi:hypothetical protein
MQSVLREWSLTAIVAANDLEVLRGRKIGVEDASRKSNVVRKNPFSLKLISSFATGGLILGTIEILERGHKGTGFCMPSRARRVFELRRV